MIWYQQTPQAILKELETSDAGLTSSDAQARLKTYGPNELSLKKEPLWKVIVEPFRGVFVAVLVAAAFVSLISHEPLEAVIISVIILVGAVIFYVQQYATNRVLRSLKKTSVQQVAVQRDGSLQTISALDLVPGDILLLAEGERVPADARIVQAEGLQVDESALTGESVPVHKHNSVLTKKKQMYEQDNMVFQGTYVVSGGGQAVVVETGSKTAFGKIAQLAGGDKTVSPVQVKIDHLISLMVKAIGVLALVVFALSLARGIPTSEALRFVLSLSVSAVPEGLPVALTVIIVLGMRRMAKHKALVHSFKAIEDIGLVTTIATDKTGTLTKNKLTVVDSWSLDKEQVTTIAGMTLDVTQRVTDPLDQAIIDSLKTDSHTTVNQVYPFDNALRMSGAYSQSRQTIFFKGAPEHILSHSTLSDAKRSQAESALHSFASKGYRVIAVAKHKFTGKPPKNLTGLKDQKLDFIGFLALADELREESSAAIKAAQAAGISVRMITGDHYETAYNIGKKLGLATSPDQVIQGTELPKEVHALAQTIKAKTVFARILPEDKFRVLQALKETEITAMTGDGVNDVPALTNAHVGIAMGSGSDIARDAGGIVLLDDNFATIVNAIAEGRKIFANIRRMLFYLLATSMGEMLTMIGALLLGFPLPITAIQVLWINLVTDTALVLPLGLEQAEDGTMQKPPRRPNEPLLNRILLSRLALVALTMAIVTLSIVGILKGQGQSTEYIQTVAFMALVVAQWTNAFNARSEYGSLLSGWRRLNIGMLVGLLVGFSLQMLVMFGPLQDVFAIADVPTQVLLTTSGIMLLAIAGVAEIHKLVSRIIRDAGRQSD